MSHRQFLLKTLELAKKGKGYCAPNPAVGALIVRDGDIICESYHLEAGACHAEAAALKKLNYPILDATLYISLEPCNHWGKTPPCVDEIIRSGIKRVVWAYNDPNPQVAQNNSKQVLEESGVVCEHLPQPEIDDFYQDYQYWTMTQMPYSIMKMAQSFDGKIAQTDRKRVHLTNDAVNEFTHHQRNHADGLLTTAKTVLYDNPKLNVRLNGSVIKKTVVILDKSLEVDSQSQLFETAKHCLIFYDNNLRARQSYPDNCQLIATPLHNDHLDMAFVMRALGEYGFHRLWIEVGAKCFTSFLREEQVKELFLYVSPMWLGDTALSAYQSDEVLKLKNKKISWQIITDTAVARIELQKDGGALCLQEL